MDWFWLIVTLEMTTSLESATCTPTFALDSIAPPLIAVAFENMIMTPESALFVTTLFLSFTEIEVETSTPSLPLFSTVLPELALSVPKSMIEELFTYTPRLPLETI